MSRIRRRQFVIAGSALLAARMVHAQPQQHVRRIGLLGINHRDHPAAKRVRVGIIDALRRLGYRDKENLAVELRYADNKPERLPVLAAELVRLDVEVIVSPNDTTTRAIQRATRTVPVVMVNSNLAVENGFVESHARPGGNITGLDVYPTIEIAAKTYQLLKLAVPNAKIAASLSNPKAPLSHLYGDKFLQRVATATGLTIVTVDLTRAEELSQALERVVASRADVLFVSGDEVTTTVVIADIAAFAAKRKLISIGTSATYTSVGGLLYYGFSSAANLERAASYVDRILRGAKPAELPVEQPSKYELVLNTRTAKAMGLTLPPSFMLHVNRTVE